MLNNQPIGLIDSGVGGLSILNEVAKQLPNENLIYLGDNKRAPYGVRSVDQIKLFTNLMVKALKEYNIKALVVACNTITAHMLETLQQTLTIPVIGVIDPAARKAVETSENKQIGVIGTDSTIASNAYQNELMQLDDEVVVLPLATQLFVDLVETNNYHLEESSAFVKETLIGLNATTIDTLILGCTHFPFLKEHIQQAFDRPINLVDASTAIPEVLVEEIEASDENDRIITLLTTGEVELFTKIATDFLDGNDFEVEKIELGEK